MEVHKCFRVLGMSKGLIRKTSVSFVNTLSRSESGPLLRYKTLVQKCFWRNFYQQRSFNVKNMFNGMKLSFIVVTGMGIGGGVYGYFFSVPDRKNRVSVFRQLQFSGSEITQLDDNDIEPQNKGKKNLYENEVVFPEVKISRSISGPVQSPHLALTLFQYQNCPFCCKVRAFLDFYGFPYDIVEVNPVFRNQLRFSEYKKVPVVLARDSEMGPYTQLQDSTVIISTLGTYLLNPNEGLHNACKQYKPTIYSDEDGKAVAEVMNRYFIMYGEQPLNGKSFEDITKERKWRRWVDNELVHVLSPNIYRTYWEAVDAFHFFSEAGEWKKNFNRFERGIVIYVGATAMYFVGKRLKKRHKLKGDVRESLYEMCRIWMKEVGMSKFMGGELPNLADLAVYGALNSIEGCQAFQDALQNTNIGSWYKHMKEAVKSNAGAASITKV